MNGYGFVTVSQSGVRREHVTRSGSTAGTPILIDPEMPKLTSTQVGSRPPMRALPSALVAALAAPDAEDADARQFVAVWSGEICHHHIHTGADGRVHLGGQ